MNERNIELEGIDLQSFYGENNAHFQKIKSSFPKLKIVGRGNKINAIGPTEVLDTFEQKVAQITHHLSHFNRLTTKDLNLLLEENETSLKFADEVILHGQGGRKIKARTPGQMRLVTAIEQNDMVFAMGPAGTGKTYTGVAMAVKALKLKEVRRIILTRPAVEAGESLGFLPGDLKEKLDPYLQPLYDALRDMIPPERLKNYLEKGVIEVAPLAFMRGRTLDHAFVILDEAQNTTHPQMKMFLTRMGANAKFLITGDPGQVDLPHKQKSGLKEALLILNNTTGIGFVELDDKDVVRHPIVRRVLKAYENSPGG